MTEHSTNVRVPLSGRTPVCDAPTCAVPDPATRADGQHVDHWILSDAERAKGFVRPVRLRYQHVGPAGPQFPTQPLSAEDRERFADVGYVAFEPYPEGHRGSCTGRYWTRAQLDAVGKGCGGVTSMPQKIAETYAAQPGFYGSTFCCGCAAYLPVGATGEFVWDGTTERVGT